MTIFSRPRTTQAAAVLFVVVVTTVGCGGAQVKRPEILLRVCDTIPRGLPAVFPVRRSASERTEAGTSGLSGAVADSLTGFALSHAMLKVSGPVEQSTTTDSTGAFSMVGIPPGSYRVVVARVGWEPLVRRLTLSRDSIEFLTLKLRYEACP